MKNKILSNLSYILCGGIGLLHFIFLALPYAAAFFSYNLGGFGSNSGAEMISGYRVMSLWDGGFGGVMSALFQILILLFAILMLAYGAYALLLAFGILKEDILPAGTVSRKHAAFALYIYAALHVLLLIFLIVLSATNQEGGSEFGISVSAGIRLSAGVFIALLFSLAAAVLEKILPAKLGVEEEAALSYVCTGCGKKVKAGTNFCADCGGKIEAVVKEPIKEEPQEEPVNE